MHIGSNPSLEHGLHPGVHSGHDNRLLNKAFFRDILSAHYRQPDLKVNIEQYVLIIEKISFNSVYVLPLKTKVKYWVHDMTTTQQNIYSR